MTPEALKELDRLFEYYLEFYHRNDAMIAAKMKLRGDDPLTSSKLPRKLQAFECCGGKNESSDSDT